MARSHGYRRRTRSLLRSKGVRGLSSILREYSLNDRVVIKIDPAQVKGMPHRRFNGLVGVVKDVGRRALTIEVPVGEKMKVVIARKEHVSPLEGR
ncbi:MAG: 50S ribosomal protein L21 [Thaumarchaeota archaeon]|nr:MAG: 50S ribosomal protein L21 [Nitrososphaerota archaeon]